METRQIIAGIDEEISRLQQVKKLLSGGGGENIPSLHKVRKKRTMSAEGRARIAAAQRARWAKKKKVGK